MECGRIYVVTDLLNALEDTVGTCNNILDYWIISRLLLGLFRKIKEHNSDESHNCDDEATEGDGAHMVVVSDAEASRDICITLLACIGVKVVGGCGNHHNKVAGILEPGGDPEDSEKHE